MTLHDLRKQRGMTMRALATAIGVSKRTVAAYEYGERRPSPEVAEKIAAVFSLSISQIWSMFYKAERSQTP